METPDLEKSKFKRIGMIYGMPLWVVVETEDEEMLEMASKYLDEKFRPATKEELEEMRDFELDLMMNSRLKIPKRMMSVRY